MLDIRHWIFDIQLCPLPAALGLRALRPLSPRLRFPLRAGGPTWPEAASPFLRFRIGLLAASCQPPAASYAWRYARYSLRFDHLTTRPIDHLTGRLPAGLRSTLSQQRPLVRTTRLTLESCPWSVVSSPWSCSPRPSVPLSLCLCVPVVLLSCGPVVRLSPCLRFPLRAGGPTWPEADSPFPRFSVNRLPLQSGCVVL